MLLVLMTGFISANVSSTLQNFTAINGEYDDNNKDEEEEEKEEDLSDSCAALLYYYILSNH